jgi:hypothetical protein
MVALLLGFAAWHATGVWLLRRARQEAADRWAELRVCLLGEGLVSGQRASERLRLVAMAAGSEPDWPGRCTTSARALDAALATQSLRQKLGALPPADAMLSEGDAGALGALLDTITERLEAAALPAPAGAQTVKPAPAPLAALLRAADLHELARAPLDGVEVSLDPVTGRGLRLLVGGRRVCKLVGEKRWQGIACEKVAGEPAEGMRLARVDGEAPALVYRAGEGEGWFDAASGVRLWRPRDPETQALVRESGLTTIVHATRRRDGSVDEHRAVRLLPGRSPTSKRLSIPDRAERLLLPDAVLSWWRHGDSETLQAQEMHDDRDDWLGPKRRLGTLPAGSRYLADCASGYMQAVLFSGTRASLVLREKSMFAKILDVGSLEGVPSLSCHGDAAILLSQRDGTLLHRRCSVEGCRESRAAVPDGAAMVAVGTRVVLVWAREGEPLRLRMGRPTDLAYTADQLLLDDAAHGGIDVTRLRLIASDGLALALLQGQGGRLFALRIDERGDIRALRAPRRDRRGQPPG